MLIEFPAPPWLLSSEWPRKAPFEVGFLLPWFLMGHEAQFRGLMELPAASTGTRPVPEPREVGPPARS